MRLRFVVHNPHIWGPIVSEILMDVKEDSTVGEIKREILPKLIGTSAYGTYSGEKPVNIISQPPEPEQAALTDTRSPSIHEQLIQKFGRSNPPKPPLCFQIPSAYLLWPSWTYGEESKWHDAAHFFVVLMRKAKLNNKMSIKHQEAKEDARIAVSIDIDFALQCSGCKKPLDLGHLYHAVGTDLAGVYTMLDAFCPQCGLKRMIESLPPAIVAVHDRVRTNLQGLNTIGTHMVVQASNWMQNELLG